jgi:hypothetical protein
VFQKNAGGRIKVTVYIYGEGVNQREGERGDVGKYR